MDATSKAQCEGDKQGRRQFNYEPLDATSKAQDRVFEQVPKDKKFMIAVLLGIFCSITTAEIVEQQLDEVLYVRTLKQAVEVVANYARRVIVLLPCAGV